ncbi:hypothetical protein CAPTEDRAFT_211572 [Capitella teleta]|uniref:Alpha-L-iduronidase n=1 Tax=Capitella teleta TaxID=283909 RepID=R7TWI8_CAPTE|nr:hypothetical protein CAPTEDRAFT_211572 [Capitella teleta]|eukprot:ELT95325.1 hypothetical protein CAPTEDRAFT_211572 [Capitella teleta]
MIGDNVMGDNRELYAKTSMLLSTDSRASSPGTDASSAWTGELLIDLLITDSVSVPLVLALRLSQCNCPSAVMLVAQIFALTFCLSLLFVKSITEHSPHTEHHVDVFVESDSVKRNISHFWESTGFCPPDPHQSACAFFLSESMRQNLAFLGSIPNGGLKQVRMHWLLDAVYVTQVKQRNVIYNFTCLDEVIEILWQNGLKPGFELMGNPSNIFTDFQNNTQVRWWADLVEATASRFADQYGLGYVASWNFETWNEPKRHHFDGLNFTLKGFLNYYDACAEGLRRVSSLLRLGGPGGECHEYDLSSFSWGLLNHTAHGVSFFSGKEAKSLDFISIHKKGEIPNNTAVILQKEEYFHTILLRFLPSLRHIPLQNNEADPIVTWSRAYSFRADATYAAMATKIIATHQQRPHRLQLLSNDNAFLSFNPSPFSQRTLLARFQINETSRGHQVQFIRKPIYSVLALLSLIGETEVESSFKVDEINFSSSIIGVLASVHSPSKYSRQDCWQLTALVYLSEDTRHEFTSDYFNVSIQLSIPKQHTDVMYTTYLLSNSHGNPYSAWKAAQRPLSPNFKLLRQMRDQEGPVRVLPPSRLKSSNVSVRIQMPGVVVFHLCARAPQGPDQVNGLAFQNITKGQVLITWSDHCVNTKCITTFEVEFSQSRCSAASEFNLINPIHTIFTSFVFMREVTDSLDPVQGCYRVRAIDFWGRAGEFSPERIYSSSESQDFVKGFL